MGLMALLKPIAILLLCGVALKLLRGGDGRRAEGLVPRFGRSRMLEVERRLSPEIW